MTTTVFIRVANRRIVVVVARRGAGVPPTASTTTPTPRPPPYLRRLHMATDYRKHSLRINQKHPDKYASE